MVPPFQSPAPPTMTAHRNLGEDVQKKREHRQVEADTMAAEALAQVLWHRNYSRGQVHWCEEPAQ